MVASSAVMRVEPATAIHKAHSIQYRRRNPSTQPAAVAASAPVTPSIASESL